MMSKITRRIFVQKSSALLFGILFSNITPTYAQENKIAEGKDKRLIVLNNRPWNIETPAHLLDHDITPTDCLFVRNNGIPPRAVDCEKWTLTITGESVVKPKTYTLQQLQQLFPHYSYQLVLECAGNGRNEYHPPTSGNQWTTGAVGCPKWTGVRLRDVLQDVGVKDNAVYIAFYGADTHLSGDKNKKTISRGVPINKAYDNEALIAWKMNDEKIPIMHGNPLRLVFGGYPGSTCGKWLTHIVIRNKIHDGAKMGGYSYRIPKFPVTPGQNVAEKDMKIITQMPVKSIVTFPRSGTLHPAYKTISIRGYAWAGERKVREVFVSTNFGSTWKKCRLAPPRNKMAWQKWQTNLSFSQKGYYEIWARAVDDHGKSQPMVLPGWNPKGYLNNACHRIAIRVA